jgi:hypothetical protein
MPTNYCGHEVQWRHSLLHKMPVLVVDFSREERNVSTLRGINFLIEY